MPSTAKRVLLSALFAILFLSFPRNAFAASCTTSVLNGVTTCTGSLLDGAALLIEVPPNWNGILFLYSHGYVVPGTPNPPQDAAISDPVTHGFMLFSGFALAGSSYAHAGWAIQEALFD